MTSNLEIVPRIGGTVNTTARILAGKALADASRRMLKAAARMADADMEPRGQADALSMAERATTDADSALRDLHYAELPPHVIESADAYHAYLNGVLVPLPTGRCSKCHENTGTFIDEEQGCPVTTCCGVELIDEGGACDAAYP